MNKNYIHNPQSCHIPVVLNFYIHIRIIQEIKCDSLFTPYLKLYVSVHDYLVKFLKY